MTEIRALAADGVVVLGSEIVLLERDHPPEAGRWVLPGGMVEPDETARTACAREVREETGLDVRPVSFVGLYDAPGRDPRGNVSAAYLCLPTDDAEPEPRAEARRVGTFAPEDLPELGFDHGGIVADALGGD
ncbi:NUDIX hydrolase [Salinirubellus sp. GCM10025818]|uniref:NUDIX hydrolase n=1 Tax=Salinirubellus TaxID=2162630 RepID=UPI0030CBAA7C